MWLFFPFHFTYLLATIIQLLRAFLFRQYSFFLWLILALFLNFVQIMSHSLFKEYSSCLLLFSFSQILHFPSVPLSLFATCSFLIPHFSRAFSHSWDLYFSIEDWLCYSYWFCFLNISIKNHCPFLIDNCHLFKLFV